MRYMYGIEQHICHMCMCPFYQLDWTNYDNTSIKYICSYGKVSVCIQLAT